MNSKLQNRRIIARIHESKKDAFVCFMNYGKTLTTLDMMKLTLHLQAQNIKYKKISFIKHVY